MSSQALKNNDLALRGHYFYEGQGARLWSVLIHLFIVLEQANQRVAVKFFSLNDSNDYQNSVRIMQAS